MRESLFKCLQGGAFGKLGLTGGAGHEIDRLTDGHGYAEVKGHATMLAVWARDFFQSIGNIRLSSQIELHIRVDWEIIPAFQADPPTLSIRLKGPLIDAERAALTNGAVYAG